MHEALEQQIGLAILHGLVVKLGPVQYALRLVMSGGMVFLID